MRVLVACEFSGVVRDAFAARGHDAWSCDLLPSETEGNHIQGDVLDILDDGWDLMIAHPDCTRLCNSGVQWLKKRNLWDEMRAGAKFFKALLDAKIPQKAIENPIPHKYAVMEIGHNYNQIIQPWQHGHKEMKATCLWLRNLPPLISTMIVGPPPKDPEERKAWAKVHRATPGPDRWKDRSRTLNGIGQAFADQWGGL